jgi:hypothetical protein
MCDFITTSLMYKCTGCEAGFKLVDGSCIKNTDCNIAKCDMCSNATSCLKCSTGNFLV